MPIQQIAVPDYISRVDRVLSPEEQADRQIKLGDFLRRSKESDLQSQLTQQSIDDNKRKLAKDAAIRKILSNDTDRAETYNALKGVDIGEAEKYKDRINKENEARYPSIQDTASATVGMAPTYAAPIPDTLEGDHMGATPSPVTPAGDRLIAAPAIARPVITTSGETYAQPMKSTAQVLRENFEKLQNETRMKSEIASAAKIAEERAKAQNKIDEANANLYEMPVDERFGKFSGQRVPKEMGIELLRLLKPPAPDNSISEAELAIKAVNSDPAISGPAKAALAELRAQHPTTEKSGQLISVTDPDNPSKEIIVRIGDDNKPVRVAGISKLTPQARGELAKAESDANNSERALKTIQGLAKQRTSAADRDLLFAYFDLAAPAVGRRMNEAEIDRLSSAGTMPERAKVWLKKAGSRELFTDEIRGDIINAGKVIVDGKRGLANKMKGGLTGNADPLGIR